MAQDHRIQQQRFELKFLVTPETARELRDFVSGHLVPDDYGVGKPDFSYDIHSIYLDSTNLHTHLATVAGSKNRFKLRVRYYDDLPDSPVFFEIKARSDNCMQKQRCAVHRAAVSLILSGQLPDSNLLISREPRHLAALQRFNQLLMQLNAQPRAHNAYLREAWVSPDNNSVRVTFDRKICIEPYFGTKPELRMDRPRYLFPEFVVLELKFTTRFPNWLRDVAQGFNLMQTSCAKYSDGIGLWGEQFFTATPIEPVASLRRAVVSPAVRPAFLAKA